MPSIFASALCIAAFAFGSFAYALEGLEEFEVCRYCGRAHELDANDYETQLAEPEGNDAASGRKYAPDRVVDMLHLKIDVTPDFDKRTVAGTTTLTFAPISKPVDQVTLNAINFAVDKIESDAKIAETVVTDETITILFAKPLPVGRKTTVHITYSCEPKQGLYFRTAALGYPKADTHIWTQGETHEARHWFPCFDFPNEKSTTEVICHIPTDMMAVSNGKPMGEKVDKKNKTKAVRWLQDKPHVSYLVCLVAGYFETLEDKHKETPLHFHTQPTLAEHAKNSFQDTRLIMDFYEKEIGVEYPWFKYDQATIRDFNSGGMENTTLTTLTHMTIFPDAWENIKSSRGLDAHEMAHQWFGDLTTCEDWSHLWLNEGFATYYTHLYEGHKLGRDEMLFGLWEDAQNAVLPQWKDTKPIVYRDYKNAWEQFDYRAYPKGSWVLHMLRNDLGEDVYRLAIKAYLEEHQYTSVVTEDLIDALETASGRELDQFFDQWVYHSGNPKLKLNYSWDAKAKLAHVSIEQTQPTSDKSLLFAFATKLRFWVDGEPVDYDIVIDKKSHDFYVPLKQQPTSVRFDPDYTILAEVDFNKPAPMLMEQLTREDDLIGRLLALDVVAKKDDQKSYDALVDRLKNDRHYGVRIAAAKAIAKKNTTRSLETLVELRDQDDARVRLAVIERIAGFYRPQARETLMSVVDAEQNPLIVAAALRGLGKYGGDAVQEKLEQAMGRESFGNVISTAAIQAAGDMVAEEVRQRVLRTVKANVRGYADRDGSLALDAIGTLWKEADDKTPARVFLQECLNDESRRLRSAAIRALGTLGDSQALPSLQAVADGEGMGRDAGAAKDAIKRLEVASPLAPNEIVELRKVVSELQKSQAKLEKQLEEMKAKDGATK